MQTISRAIRLLRCFEGGAKILSLAELVRLLDLNKVTVHRLAQSLVAEGMLRQDRATAQYSVSYGLLELGRELLGPRGVISAARPILNRAAEATEETVMLNLRDGGAAVIVDEIVSKHPVRYSIGTGFQADLRLGAAGNAILAALPEAEVEALLARPDPQRKSGVAYTAAAMRTRLQEIRQAGFARSVAHRASGAIGFAAAFFGPEGTVIGAVAIVHPETRNIEAERQAFLSETVMETAHEMTNALRFSAPEGLKETGT